MRSWAFGFGSGALLLSWWLILPTAPPALPQTVAPAFIHHTNSICTNCPAAPLPLVAFRYGVPVMQPLISWDTSRQRWQTNQIPVRWALESRSNFAGSWTGYTNFIFDGTNVLVTRDTPARVFRVVLYP